MVLKKITLITSLAFVAYVGVSCSSKEDRESYDKYYGSGRAEREKTALEKEASEGNAKVSPDSVSTMTKSMDTEIAGGNETPDTKPETAEKPVEEISQKAEEAKPAEAAKTQGPPPADIAALLNKHTCSACHRPYERLVGPAYSEVAKKKYSQETILELVYKPQPEHWPGYPPMAPMTQVPKEDVQKLAKWINSL